MRLSGLLAASPELLGLVSLLPLLARDLGAYLLSADRELAESLLMGMSAGVLLIWGFDAEMTSAVAAMQESSAEGTAAAVVVRAGPAAVAGVGAVVGTAAVVMAGAAAGAGEGAAGGAVGGAREGSGEGAALGAGAGAAAGVAEGAATGAGAGAAAGVGEGPAPGAGAGVGTAAVVVSSSKVLMTGAE